MADLGPIGRTSPVSPTRRPDRQRESAHQPRRQEREKQKSDRPDDDDDRPLVDEYA